MGTVSLVIHEYSEDGRRPNRLIHEKSPYLLQHAFNPVDWYPWDNEAFKKAHDEDKPVFLSVGYSTCYWCHVMEREVFENDEIAGLMNENFVCIKLDREERPDVDRVYMAAVQAMTGSGGWPISVFLTPERKPFFGGTYFPATPRPGRPGFPQILEHISRLWKTDRVRILASGEQITDFLQEHSLPADAVTLNDSILERAYRQFEQSYDTANGGFGGAPKFPQPAVLNFLLRYYARTAEERALQMTLRTLRRMAEGGMHDQIGGGFHRYSVDQQWRVPHFEKMLYDQAQLASVYLDAYQITHDEFLALTARDILDYVLRNMTPREGTASLEASAFEGGFASAEDAESAAVHNESTHDEKPVGKEEGAFYLWGKNEIENILGDELGGFFNYFYGVIDAGNALHDPMKVFVGKNILYIAHTVEEVAGRFKKKPDEIRKSLAEGKRRLFAEREKRPRPHLDDKVITAWNGLMISAFAKAYQILGEPLYLNASQRSAAFIASKLYDRRSQNLHRRFRDGEARFDGTLQDYAFFVQGLLDLYEASFDIHWLEMAIEFMGKQNELFWDSGVGGFFETAPGDSLLLVRTKEDYDGAEPTGNSIAALNLLRLSHMTANKEWRALAEKTIASYGARVRQHPQALAQMLVALDRSLASPKEIIVAGEPDADDTRQLLEEIHAHFIPGKILLMVTGAEGQKKLLSYCPFVEGKTAQDGKATAYVCENYSCQLPTSERAVVARLLTEKKNS